MSTPRKRFLVIGAVGLLLAGTATATAAAFHDHAEVNLGAAGALGNAQRFNIQVKDAAQNWQEAENEASAVVLPVTPQAILSTTVPMIYEARFRVDVNSPRGEVIPQITTLPGCDTTCSQLVDAMRIDVTKDNTPLGQGLTVAEFNANADHIYRGVNAGEEHRLLLSITADPATDPALNGARTAFGVTFKGMSVL